MAPGRATEKGGKSGGVAIAWRGGLNITSPQIVCPHRAVSVEVHTHNAGDIQLYCVYGDAQGTWKSQKAMWQAISAEAAVSGKPFIWGGDWNANSLEVQEIVSSLNIPAGNRAPDRSTCVTVTGGSIVEFLWCTISLVRSARKCKW